MACPYSSRGALGRKTTRCLGRMMPYWSMPTHCRSISSLSRGSVRGGQRRATCLEGGECDDPRRWLVVGLWHLEDVSKFREQEPSGCQWRRRRGGERHRCPDWTNAPGDQCTRTPWRGAQSSREWDPRCAMTDSQAPLKPPSVMMKKLMAKCSVPMTTGTSRQMLSQGMWSPSATPTVRPGRGSGVRPTWRRR
jgi:hypothetical protein